MGRFTWLVILLSVILCCKGRRWIKTQVEHLTRQLDCSISLLQFDLRAARTSVPCSSKEMGRNPLFVPPLLRQPVPMPADSNARCPRESPGSEPCSAPQCRLHNHYWLFPCLPVKLAGITLSALKLGPRTCYAEPDNRVIEIHGNHIPTLSFSRCAGLG